MGSRKVTESESIISNNEHSMIEDVKDDLSSEPDSSDDDYNLDSVSELSFSEGEEENLTITGDPLIYEGAPIRLSESMTAVLSYVIRHELNGKQIQDLLQILNLHCRAERNNMLTSLHFFKKYFTLLQSPVVCHYYCSSCYENLVGKDDPCKNAAKHPKSTGIDIFVELPIIQQLQDLFSQKEFYDNFNYPHTRNKSSPNNLEDIYDGQLFKELLENNFLGPHNPHNFSMIINSDGVPVFHSAKKSLWPIYLNILNLPPHLRFLKKFTLIAGLWFGGKPSANLMLKPLIPPFLKVRNGFVVRPPGSDGDTVAKGVVLAATTDLPAKVMLLGMASYSGSFGCQICKVKGGSVKIVKKTVKKKSEQDKTTSVWVYKYSEAEDLRSHEETVKFAAEAQEVIRATGNIKKTNINGVKFPSALFNIMYDAIRGFSIDDLHTLYLGVTKTLINLWFEAKNRSQPFSIRQHLQSVDQRLKAVKLPNFLESEVLTIEEEISFWKAKDFLTWLHYLSIPILDQIMPDMYLEHHVDLVSALHVLQSSSISPEALISCDLLLKRYVKQFERLYGTRHMSMVVHLLRHLAYVVNNLGPLKYLSCFPYESLNGSILKMIHGTRYVETQLASGCYLIRRLPHHLDSLKEGKVKNFCERVLHPSKRLKILEKISEDIFSVGTYNLLTESNKDCVLECLEKCSNYSHDMTIESFQRLKKERFLFVSRSYLRSVKTISYSCSFVNGDDIGYGAIDLFVKTTSSLGAVRFYAIVQVAKVFPYVAAYKPVPHIMEYELTAEYKALPICHLQNIMVFVNVGKKCFVCEPLDHSLKS